MNEKKVLLELAKRAESDETFRSQLREDPSAAIKQYASLTPEPLRSDRWIYRVVISVLSFVVLLVVGSVMVLMLNQETEVKVPDVLISLGSAAIGALAGLLAPSPIGRERAGA